MPGHCSLKLAIEWFDSQSWLVGRTKIHSQITLFRMRVEMQRSGYE